MDETKLYLDSGYLNMPEVIKNTTDWIFVFGGRGVGKTYGALKYVLDNNIQFFYLRRLQTQIDEIKKPKKNPFNKINTDLGYNVQVKPDGKTSINFVQNGLIVGSGAALSTIANIRGFDASDIDIIIFDEFIPEKQESPIRGEADALFNAYETINRNRELLGKPPVKLLCLANANAIDCPVFIALQLVLKVEKMKRNKIKVLKVGQDITLVNMEDSPIAEQKQNTILYRVTRNTDFAKMALNNNFAYNDFDNIDSVKIKGLKALVTVGEITIYKSEDCYYISLHRSGDPDQYGTSDRELLSFQHKYWRLYNRYIDGKVKFENYLCKALFLKYIDK